MTVPVQARLARVHRGEAAARRLIAAGVLVWRSPPQRRLVLALIVGALRALSFAHIAEDYLTNDPLARWDVTFARWLFGEREPELVDVFRVVTFVGSPATTLAVVAIASVVLYRRRRLAEAALLPLVLVGAELLDLVLKLSFHRPRPEVAFVHLDTYSFPSGHAMTATAVYGALAYVLVEHVRGPGRRMALVVGTASLVGSSVSAASTSASITSPTSSPASRPASRGSRSQSPSRRSTANGSRRASAAARSTGSPGAYPAARSAGWKSAKPQLQSRGAGTSMNDADFRVPSSGGLQAAGRMAPIRPAAVRSRPVENPRGPLER